MRVAGNLAGSLAVLGVAGALAFGLPAVDRAVPAGQPLPAGQRYAVGGGVSLTPPPGALLDVTKTRPRADRGSALFLLGPVRYAVVVEPFTGTLAEAEERLRRKITSARGYQATGRERTVTTAAGLVGVQGGYTAPGRVGRYSVFLAPVSPAAGGGGRGTRPSPAPRGGPGRLVIEVTISGTESDLRGVLARLEESTRSLAHGGDP